MGRAFDLVLSLVAAAMVALLLLGVGARDADMTTDAVCTDALGAAGLLFAAVAAGSLLKRQ
jgi:hypothetical protein